MAEGGGMYLYDVNIAHKSVTISVRTRQDDDALNTHRP